MESGWGTRNGEQEKRREVMGLFIWDGGFLLMQEQEQAGKEKGDRQGPTARPCPSPSEVWRLPGRPEAEGEARGQRGGADRVVAL